MDLGQVDAEPGRALLTDADLDRLVDDYVRAAALARRAGFDFVDVKHCHGYLLHELLRRARRWGVELVSVTAASPYYAPHVQRPAYFPPSDGYDPPRDPLIEVDRLVRVTAELAAAHPDLTIVASGLSYLQQWLPHAGQALLAAGGAAAVGYGRMALSYPHLPQDVLAGRPLDVRWICRTLSDCTTAPRQGLVSGCYPYDPFYKALPERDVLVAAKRRVTVTARVPT